MGKKKYNDDDSRPVNDVDNIIPADNNLPTDAVIDGYGKALLDFDRLSDIEFARFLRIINLIRHQIGSKLISDEVIANALNMDVRGFRKRKRRIIEKVDRIGHSDRGTEVPPDE
jgi:hypothetical protein